MRPILLLPLLFIGLTTFAQEGTQHQVEPKGVYKEINLSNDIRVIQLLMDTSDNHSRVALIDSVENNANNYTPPVLYVLSNVLFSQKKYNEACYWFYLAQLRARYDVNRCTDKTANADAYNINLGMVINDYAFHHLDSLKIIVQKVVRFERVNEEQYDQRWINLTGMEAMSASLGNKPTNKKLSIDKGQWPAIKKKTIDDYYGEFEAATNKDIIVDKSKLLGGDYRLFQNTPAWELTKAVRDEDTSKIKEQVNKDKSLLRFREPRFGQPLLTLAVTNKNYKSVKTLLELGADPNMQDLSHGESPLTASANIGINGVDADPRFLKLLLKYGGDPNAAEKNQQKQDGNTPLIIACQNSNLEYVRILVDAGADVNAVSVYGDVPLEYACDAVGLNAKPDLVIYLIEKGADYKHVLYKTIPEGEKKYITDAMRYWRFDLGSDEYKKKMQLVDFLKKNGMDYWKVPVPKEFIPDYSKEYLEKY